MPRQSRRPPPSRREYDEASLDLFDLLWEQSAPSTPINWFSNPWRNGENAIRLALDLLGGAPLTADQRELKQFLLGGYHLQEPGDAYWAASSYRMEARTDEGATTISAFILEHALEMFLRWRSASDGGGQLHNDHLLAICDRLLDQGGALEPIEPIIRRWRQRDIVGLFPEENEPEDAEIQRRLRAFETAWKAGLFKVAFCV